MYTLPPPGKGFQADGGDAGAGDGDRHTQPRPVTEARLAPTVPVLRKTGTALGTPAALFGCFSPYVSRGRLPTLVQGPEIKEEDIGWKPQSVRLALRRYHWWSRTSPPPRLPTTLFSRSPNASRKLW